MVVIIYICGDLDLGPNRDFEYFKKKTHYNLYESLLFRDDLVTDAALLFIIDDFCVLELAVTCALGSSL